MTTATDPRDYPAIEGRTVTEGHAQVCRERGHATTIRDGVEQETCPRCGDFLEWGIPAADERELRVSVGDLNVIARALSVLSDKLLDDAANYPSERATYVAESEKINAVRARLAEGVRS